MRLVAAAVAGSLLLALPAFAAEGADGGAPRKAKAKGKKAGRADAGAPSTAPDAGASSEPVSAAADAGSSAKPDAGARVLSPASNVEVPTTAEAKKVLDYYYRGRQIGPLLVELKACLKVDSSEGPTKSECLEPVSGPVKKGSTVHAWTLWIVPDGGDYDDVVLQWTLDGQVRSTTDVKLTAAFRSRTWRPSAVHKAGKWEIKVLRGGATLGSTVVNVVD